MFAIPMAMTLIILAWFLLRKLYPTSIEDISVKIDSTFDTSSKAYTVYATIAATVLLWITSSLHGVNSYTVALLPVIIFSLSGIINTNDIKQINWDVLWLIAGGIALGYALEKSGLASAFVHSIPFAAMSPFVVLMLMSIVAMIMATFMSNTANGEPSDAYCCIHRHCIERLRQLWRIKLDGYLCRPVCLHGYVPANQYAS